MREVPRDPERLQHIQEACQRLLTHSVEEWQELIKKEPLLYFGIVKAMEIIGEAAYKLTSNFKADHSETKWKAIEAMRHFLVHEYYNVMEEEIWNNLKDEIKPLLNQIDNYLAAYE